MMIKILYISISGNTRAFIKRLINYAETQQETDPHAPQILAVEVDDNTLPTLEDANYFAFVPTYLEGGNGVDNGDQEILTESLRDYLAYQDNASRCLGIVGSGNKNFNRQYCLTAKQYAQAFDVPFLADYELRGTTVDITRIYNILKERVSL